MDLNTRYATLSHRWGNIQILKLLSDNEKSLRREIPFLSLPRTFQDAINICLAIELRYIWIDSLCIIQDSKTDWNYEAARMCTIYSNAWLGIAATFARDGHDGLFSEESSRPASVVEASCRTERSVHAGKLVAMEIDAWWKEIELAPLNCRAWVIQERVLSPRTVHFAYDQMWWSCQGLHVACEAMPTGEVLNQDFNKFMADLLQKPARDVELKHAWIQLVQRYTSAGITYDTDRPMAIAGIAEAVAQAQSILPCDYLAGVWRDGFVRSLIWNTSIFTTPRPHAISHTRSASTPTWSWLSLNAPVGYGWRFQPGEPFAQFLDACTYPVAGPFGPVNGGYVTLKGPLLSLRRSSDPRRYKSGDYELGTSAFHTPQAINLVLDNEDLERLRDLWGIYDEYDDVPDLFAGDPFSGPFTVENFARGRFTADNLADCMFDCWDWPEMGKEIFFACLYSGIGISSDYKWVVGGLLLTCFDCPDGGGIGYSRMARLDLVFREEVGVEEYLKNLEQQQYTIY
ncbi:hypothetical protein FKW77_000524 [Venturia effusa]|uniref:Heterokaryon incompatibility domain-containing protein n=1 Tax=Venturia effusa TaxID=50376 RepID=A0A517LQH2_9PEZI|nr:hypothetical protein FKW77_000524 [Venturia effusa]